MTKTDIVVGLPRTVLVNRVYQGVNRVSTGCSKISKTRRAHQSLKRLQSMTEVRIVELESGQTANLTAGPEEVLALNSTKFYPENRIKFYPNSMSRNFKTRLIGCADFVKTEVGCIVPKRVDKHQPRHCA